MIHTLKKSSSQTNSQRGDSQEFYDPAYKRRHKKEKSHQSYKHLLEKYKLEENKVEEIPQTSTCMPSSSGNEEEAKNICKKVSASVLKKTFDKKAKRVKMSSKDTKSREDVMAAREAKKLAKQKTKTKEGHTLEELKAIVKERKQSTSESKDDKPAKERKHSTSEPKVRKKSHSEQTAKSSDEVDKAVTTIQDEIKAAKPAETDRDKVFSERAAKKAAKLAKKSKPLGDVSDMTIKDVVETLRDIKNVANDVKDITAEVKALDLKGAKDSDDKKQETEKSKAELKAERRAKQEAQRAAKQAAVAASVAQSTEAKAKEAPESKLVTDAKKPAKAMSPKPRTAKKGNDQNRHRGGWFAQEYNDNILNLKTMPVNSHIHPAFVKLGVQLISGVVIGTNARCIALLDALKKMTKDYMLPAKTEFGRGLDSHLTETVAFLAALRQPSAAEKNAVTFYRHQLLQLPNNVNEYEAKKTLQEEIDRYVREQIEMAGEAISAAVQKKISDGDVILTYGFSSLVERCLVDAHRAGIRFTCVVCGARGAQSARGARELARRLRAGGVLVHQGDVTSLAGLMQTVSKVVVGATSILSNGSVLAGAGTGVVCRAARGRHVPVLVLCETHKFSERVQTDAFVHNELGSPDELNAAGDESWPLRAWRTMPLAILNVQYDVTPPGLVSAVVTELAVLPCTSAPVVLRFRGTAYGI